MSKSEIVMAVDRIINDAKNRGIIHLNAEKVRGSRLQVNGRELINFGSCSYLGLEFDPRLIAGSQQAVQNFGTQFSASRAYISCGLYAELEGIFTQIFESPIMVAPTTTLGHIATLPVIIGPDDAVIVDHQVHSSVQGAVELVKNKGTYVELIRHNRMDMLEERLSALSSRYDKVWYMADGIYSMFGDKAPLEDIERLLNAYDNFHFYVDDAHGMSCYGERGQGYVLSKMKMHTRMVVAMSLAKAFATGGAVFVFPTQAMADLVRNCGGPMITSGPMQPGALGAAIASGKIHLSEEYADLRDDLHAKIAFTNEQLIHHALPLIAENDSPVFFVGCGLPKVGYNLVKRMNNQGYMTNLGIFPAVPMKNTGLRFTITRLNDFQEIEHMVKNLAIQHSQAVREEGSSMKSIHDSFKMKKALKRTEVEEFIDEISLAVDLEVTHVQSISDLSATEWDNCHGSLGCHDYAALLLFEQVFSFNQAEENRWEWDYIVIRDKSNRVVLSTFLTTALYKDDMLANSEVSEQIELLRKTKGDLYMTTRTLALGCPITTGEHLYLDQRHSLKDKAVDLFIKKVLALQESRKSDNILLRDFLKEEQSLSQSFFDNGFLSTPLPATNSLNINGIESLEKYIEARSYKSRRHIRSRILKFKDQFEITAPEIVSDSRCQEYYKLYKGLKQMKSELNTFDLPEELFKEICADKTWDKLEVLDKMTQDLVAVIFNRSIKGVYSLMFIGVAEKFSGESAYRQALLASVGRAIDLGCDKVYMGFTADIEKRHLGCDSIPTHAYLQAKEHYSMQVIENMQVHKKVSAV